MVGIGPKRNTRPSTSPGQFSLTSAQVVGRGQTEPKCCAGRYASRRHCSAPAPSCASRRPSGAAGGGSGARSSGGRAWPGGARSASASVDN